MQSTVKERLKKFIEHLQISTREFERECGLSNGYVNSIDKTIMPIKMKGITDRYPQLNPLYILHNVGEMIEYSTSNEPVPIYGTAKENNHLSIPLIPFEAMAGWLSVDNPGVNVKECEQYNVPEFANKGADYIIRVSGSSMYPKYSNGDLLACKKITDILLMRISCK